MHSVRHQACAVFSITVYERKKVKADGNWTCRLNEDQCCLRGPFENPDELRGSDRWKILNASEDRLKRDRNGALTEQKEGKERGFFLKPVRVWCVQCLSFLEPQAYQIRLPLHHIRAICGGSVQI